ncbi:MULTISPECIES: 4Fe-4S binding protein [unclassified Carboxylicivirga]|uniref:ATP-binding protein n=1 Tax=Carboxylicivirga TaxID=1628153 RepID=UPI003D342D94
MHEITILSGKGGTGKTTITAALTALADSAVICDNDVDAADLFLLLQPTVLENGVFTSGWTAHINDSDCSQCGLCFEHCRYKAIELKDGSYHINPFSCEGCRLCERLCPQEAITSTPNSGNQWFLSDTANGPFVHAQMGPGEENSGKLVSFIRRKAAQEAKNRKARYLLSDGPPGIGCPVIASLTGTHQVLLVIEPTQSGWHDAQRLISLIRNFNIPISAVINKSGINQMVEQEVEQGLKRANIPLLAKIPFSRVAREAMLAQKTIVDYAPQSEAAIQIRRAWNYLAQRAQE